MLEGFVRRSKLVNCTGPELKINGRRDWPILPMCHNYHSLVARKDVPANVFEKCERLWRQTMPPACFAMQTIERFHGIHSAGDGYGQSAFLGLADGPSRRTVKTRKYRVFVFLQIQTMPVKRN
jgi:hypothetical protein